MTPKQELFATEYLVDLNATQAAIRAGYSAKTSEQQGFQLLKKPSVKAAIQRAMDARSKRIQITADYVLESIHSTMERCKQVEPVFDRKGDPVLVENADGGMAQAFTFNPMGVLKGAELLGKHLKLFTENINHRSDDGSMSPPTTVRIVGA